LELVSGNYSIPHNKFMPVIEELPEKIYRGGKLIKLFSI